MVVNDFLAALLDGIIHLHDCGLIAAPVAVIGSRKDSDDAPTVLPLIALHHELVCTSDKVEAVNVRKLFGNVLPKRVTCTPGRDSPTAPFCNMFDNFWKHVSELANKKRDKLP